MTDRRLQDIEKDALENTIRGLPRREPRAALRSRVLAATASARPPRAWTRAILAPAALIALLALDLLVVTTQDRQLARSLPARPAAMMAAAPAPDTDLSWLRDLGLPDDSVAVVALRHQAVSQDTYFSLRDSLLANGSGG